MKKDAAFVCVLFLTLTKKSFIRFYQAPMIYKTLGRNAKIIQASVYFFLFSVLKALFLRLTVLKAKQQGRSRADEKPQILSGGVHCFLHCRQKLRIPLGHRARRRGRSRECCCLAERLWLTSERRFPQTKHSVFCRCKGVCNNTS